MPTLKGCLNGDRSVSEHPAVPVTPELLADDAAAAREAGATAVHLHPRGPDGAESLAWADIAAAVAAVRARCPGLPVGVSTREGIVPDLPARLRLLSGWAGPPVGPDYASVSWHEAGATEVAELLAERGVGVEAGLFTPEAAAGFLAGDWPDRVVRVLVEAIPGVSPGPDGVAAARAILARLGDLAEPVGADGGGPSGPNVGPGPGDPVRTAAAPDAAAGRRVTMDLVVHGEREWAWPVLRWAKSAGYGIRAGLEDMTTGPDGQPVSGNRALLDWATRLS
jgi:uncharacterized protein (DUF849 family)